MAQVRFLGLAHGAFLSVPCRRAGAVAVRIGDATGKIRRAQHRAAYRTALLLQVVIKAFGQCHHGVLRHRVSAHSRRRNQSGDRCGVEDVPLILCQKQRRKYLHAVDDALEIDPEHPVPFGDARFPNRPQRRDAGVVAHHVCRTPCGQGQFGERFDIVKLRHIDWQ